MEDLWQFANSALVVTSPLLFLLPWPLFLRALLIKCAWSRSGAAVVSFLSGILMLPLCVEIFRATVSYRSVVVVILVHVLFYTIIPILLLLRLSQHKKTPPAKEN